MSKKNRKKDSSNSIFILTEIYLSFILLLPFVYNNYYFDLLEVKANYFIYLTAIFVVIFIPILLYCFKKQGIKTIMNQLNMTDMCLLFFSLILVLAYFASDYKRTALNGNYSWKTGTIFWLLCIFVYFIVSKSALHIKDFINIYLFINIVIVFVGNINIIGIDPFGFTKKIAQNDYADYLSFIGNIDWYAEYLAFVVPIAVILFLFNDKIKSDIIYAVTIYLGTISVLLCNSDSALIILLVMAVYLLYQIIQGNKIKKIGSLFCIFSASILTSFIFYKLNLLAAPLETLQKMICSIGMFVCLTIFGILLYLNDEKIKEKRKIRILFAVGIVIILMVVSLCAQMTTNADVLSKIFGRYLIFDGSWGNNRGHIWKYALKIWMSADIIHKIIGCGCDTFGIYAMKAFGADIQKIWGMRLENVHNDFLQLLINTGILGVVSYYSGFISALVSNFRKNKYAIAVSLTIISALLIGLVNNFQAITTPFLFIYLGFLNNRHIGENNE